MNHPYTVAFAIGYFYGRAHDAAAGITMPEHDMYHRSNAGFTAGLEAGRRDFQEIDLPLVALQENAGAVVLGDGVTLKEGV